MDGIAIHFEMNDDCETTCCGDKEDDKCCDQEFVQKAGNLLTFASKDSVQHEVSFVFVKASHFGPSVLTNNQSHNTSSFAFIFGSPSRQMLCTFRC